MSHDLKVNYFCAFIKKVCLSYEWLSITDKIVNLKKKGHKVLNFDGLSKFTSYICYKGHILHTVIMDNPKFDFLDFYCVIVIYFQISPLIIMNR